MKRCAAVLLTMAASAHPMLGQRGGARAGAAGGARVQGSGFRAGSPGPVQGRAVGAAARPVVSLGVRANSSAAGARVARPGGYGSDGRRGTFASDRYRLRYGGYGAGVPLVYPVLNGPIWSGWGDASLGFDAGYDSGYGAGADVGVSAGEVPGDGQGLGPGPYVGPYAAPYAGGTYHPAAVPGAWQEAAPMPEEAVTLVFRDGRAAEQIHNYALTKTRLMVLDGRPREIPLEDLDMAATEKVNRAAGVEFKVPGGR